MDESYGWQASCLDFKPAEVLSCPVGWVSPTEVS